MDKIFSILGISRKPVIRAYDGYGDADNVMVQGHVLKISPLPRKKYRQNFWLNLFGLIRLFIVRPVEKARVMVDWGGETREMYTDNQGFFRFEWTPLTRPVPGWHQAELRYVSQASVPAEVARSTCFIFIPHQYQYGFISDIDDTFLISHSSNLRKRLYVLFTKNARSRKAFEGVALHYRLLANDTGADAEPNPFFYVSSSEWNLYEYIREFCRKEQLPRGVFLLNALKRFSELLKTGQGKHAGKYTRIARILTSYPSRKYILLGDNSQEDPMIYQKIIKDFPGMIHAVYIRNINSGKEASTREIMRNIETEGVRCCLFTDSNEAISHSKKIGLIRENMGSGM